MLRKVSVRGGAENGPLAWSCQDVCLRVLPHSSTPAILSKTRLRMRLWTSRGSCPWRFIWGWGPKGEEASRTPPPLKVQVPTFAKVHLRA